MHYKNIIFLFIKICMKIRFVCNFKKKKIWKNRFGKNKLSGKIELGKIIIEEN